MSLLRMSISFSETQVHRVDQLCDLRGTTRSHVVRDAIELYLAQQGARSASLERIAMTSEFTQVAVDIMISEQMPERREDILATVQDRMEKYHA